MAGLGIGSRSCPTLGTTDLGRSLPYAWCHFRCPLTANTFLIPDCRKGPTLLCIALSRGDDEANERGWRRTQRSFDHATASRPLRWMIESNLSAGPPGRFFPRSQSETRFFETLR